jgi:uncharacterized membrane protein YjjP (DUF1212 family)
MSNGARLVCYLAAFVLFVVAALLEALAGRKVTPTVLIAAGLAVFTFVPLWDAIEAT